jgi:hypothetical protein
MKISPYERDIDVLTLYTYDSLYLSKGRYRRKEFFSRLSKEPFHHLNIDGIYEADLLAQYFKRAKTIIHFTQSEYQCNLTEISLLPAICHGVIAIGEKPPILDFQYSKFIVWTPENTTDSVITTIHNVLNNYNEYFNKLQLNPEFDHVIKNMEDKAIKDLENLHL